MANGEGSAAAGRADRSLTRQSEGAGGVGKDPLQGREGSKTIRSGVTPNPPASHRRGIYTIGDGKQRLPHFPVPLRDALGTEHCLG